MPYLRIATQGGVITPDELQRLAMLAKKWALGKIEVGFRQDLLIPCTDSQRSLLRSQLMSEGFGVEEAEAVHPNIVSSLVAQNIFPQLSWLRSGDYLDILDEFTFKPRLKINLIDPTQELIRPLTGELNFIASPTPSFWYLVVNLSELGGIHVWPKLVDGEQIALITSKGASGVTGAGFIALAATLAAVPGIPIESLALLIGIDRFMSECRAVTNLIGNGVATVAISRWEGEVTKETLRERLRGTESH